MTQQRDTRSQRFKILEKNLKRVRLLLESPKKQLSYNLRRLRFFSFLINPFSHRKIENHEF